MRKLIIKNFGPFKDLEFDMDKSRYVFIGEQASGKSTLAKIIHLFRNVTEIFSLVNFSAHVNQELRGKDIDVLFAHFMSFNFYSCFDRGLFKENTIFKYYYSIEQDKYITLKTNSEKISLSISKNLLDELRKIIDKLNVILENETDSNKIFTILKFSEYEVKKLFCDKNDSLYIPAARSFISMFSNTSYDFMKSDAFDYTIKGFVGAVDTFRRLSISQDPIALIKEMVDDENNKIVDLIPNILKGKYVFTKDKEYILMNGEQITLPLASSGQQEALWILNLIILSWYTKNNYNFIIEEPEAHLFPKAQFDIMKFIMMGANITGADLVITTHSPYVLNTLNVLMYSGQVEKGDSNNYVIEKECRINPDLIGVYYLHDGKLEDIIDPEERLINSEKIDEISFKLNNLFDSIFEFDKKMDKKVEKEIEKEVGKKE